jgi:hypothetical protein
MLPLGFTNIANGLPLNDKLLHFVCFCVLATLSKLSFEVDDSARRIWFWRHAASIFTVLAIVIGASVGSEYIQGLLPVRFSSLGITRRPRPTPPTRVC